MTACVAYDSAVLDRTFAFRRTPTRCSTHAYRRRDTFVVASTGQASTRTASTSPSIATCLCCALNTPVLAQEDREMVVAERPRGTFSQQLFLGETLDTENLQASYDAGVQALRIPWRRAGQALMRRRRQQRL